MQRRGASLCKNRRLGASKVCSCQALAAWPPGMCMLRERTGQRSQPDLELSRNQEAARSCAAPVRLARGLRCCSHTGFPRWRAVPDAKGCWAERAQQWRAQPTAARSALRALGDALHGAVHGAAHHALRRAVVAAGPAVLVRAKRGLRQPRPGLAQVLQAASASARARQRRPGWHKVDAQAQEACSRPAQHAHPGVAVAVLQQRCSLSTSAPGRQQHGLHRAARTWKPRRHWCSPPQDGFAVHASALSALRCARALSRAGHPLWQAPQQELRWRGRTWGWRWSGSGRAGACSWRAVGTCMRGTWKGPRPAGSGECQPSAATRPPHQGLQVRTPVSCWAALSAGPPTALRRPWPLASSRPGPSRPRPLLEAAMDGPGHGPWAAGA